ncbi:1226_t:CDS:1 [Scutellospora calospora]|uniref:1226_t:CDS:1 n=1 Tax=Scutellospora calospora TaxID=85575 RepID=A0ACA9KAD6_9GLOM|nr:1226_t:CDS:1 [Scutellospora calospora]
MPYVAPKTSKNTTLPLTVKQSNPIIKDARPLEHSFTSLKTVINVNKQNKSQITSIRETTITCTSLQQGNLSHARNRLLRKQNGEIVKSSFKKDEIKSNSPKHVRFSDDFKQID